ncbi:hypothetical protein [Terriglobus sp. TAA 43]|uniref:hypothetical protein n=1 Tax=Terriglobus sp. TAA 43 TaxID=278961 RepID=UPI0018DBA1FC|nr:hypothetical protein [Terriglobus sp. TAA 43]
MTVIAAACLTFISVMVNPTQHPSVVWAVVAVQMVMLARAVLLLRKRKQLLAGV